MTDKFAAVTPVIADHQLDPRSLLTSGNAAPVYEGAMFRYYDFRVREGVTYVRSLTVAVALGYRRGTSSEKKFRSLPGAMRIEHQGALATFVPLYSVETKLKRCDLYGVKKAVPVLNKLTEAVAAYRERFIK